MVFSGLVPGSEIQIRVSYKKGTVFIPQPYEVVFGSYPVLKEFKLRDQYGIKRIPSGHTQPSFLLVQGYTEASDINYMYGPGTWRSYCYVGEYRFTSLVSEQRGKAELLEGTQIFGHVCQHRKIKS